MTTPRKSLLSGSFTRYTGLLATRPAPVREVRPAGGRVARSKSMSFQGFVFMFANIASQTRAGSKPGKVGEFLARKRYRWETAGGPHPVRPTTFSRGI